MTTDKNGSQPKTKARAKKEEKELKAAPRKRSGASGTPKKSKTSSSITSAGEAARSTALEIAEAALDKKALKVEIIDVRGKVDYCDFVVVMSGRSERQVNAIAQGIEGKLREGGTRCIALEGLPGGIWVLMDFGDVVVHIFHEETRGYYDLESLWLDAARVNIEPSVAMGGSR